MDVTFSASDWSLSVTSAENTFSTTESTAAQTLSGAISSAGVTETQSTQDARESEASAWATAQGTNYANEQAAELTASAEQIKSDSQAQASLQSTMDSAGVDQISSTNAAASSGAATLFGDLDTLAVQSGNALATFTGTVTSLSNTFAGNLAAASTTYGGSINSAQTELQTGLSNASDQFSSNLAQATAQLTKDLAKASGDEATAKGDADQALIDAQAQAAKTLQTAEADAARTYAKALSTASKTQTNSQADAAHTWAGTVSGEAKTFQTAAIQVKTPLAKSLTSDKTTYNIAVGQANDTQVKNLVSPRATQATTISTQENNYYTLVVTSKQNQDTTWAGLVHSTISSADASVFSSILTLDHAEQEWLKPGPLASLIPVWGSFWNAMYQFSTGHYVYGTLDAIMTVGDVFMVGSLVEVGGKLAVTGLEALAKVGAEELTTEAIEVGEKEALEEGAEIATKEGAEVIADEGAKEVGELGADGFENELGEEAGEELNNEVCDNPPLGCFVAGTEVITGYNASTRVFSEEPIQDVQAGQMVLTRDANDPNGPLQEEEVTGTEQHIAYDLRNVTVVNSSGQSETIQATDGHLFYVQGEGWTQAEYLQAGDKLQEPDGSIALVSSNLDDPTPQGTTVYNFTVAADHTYFVGNVGISVWVHNAGCPNPYGRTGDLTTQATADAAKDQARSLGFTEIDTEVQFSPGAGALKTRYADIVATNPGTGERLVMQIGKMSARFPGLTVAREGEALLDIANSPSFNAAKDILIFIEKGTL